MKIFNIETKGCFFNDHIRPWRAAGLVLLALLFIIASKGAAGANIDINEANFEALLELSGINEVTAAKIIKYRRENKGFKTVYDLLKVDGITGELFEKIKDDISAGAFSSESAAAQPAKTAPRPPARSQPSPPVGPQRAFERIGDDDETGAGPVSSHHPGADDEGKDEGVIEGEGEGEGEDEGGGAAAQSPAAGSSKTADGVSDKQGYEISRQSDYSFEEGRKAPAVKKSAAPAAGRSKGARIGDIKKIELTPQNYYKVIIGLMRLAKYDKAESNIADFIRKFPTDKKIDDMNYLMGACLEEAEKYGEAIETYRRVYDNQNSELRAIALFRIGVCYDLMGKPADALDNYRKYAASYPSSSCVKEAENRIDEMLKTK